MSQPVVSKIEVVAEKMYGAGEVTFTKKAERDIAEIERLGAAGAPLVDGPNELPDGTRFCWVSAPDNVRVELIQWPV